MSRTIRSVLGVLVGMVGVASATVVPAHAESRPPQPPPVEEMPGHAAGAGGDEPGSVAELLATMAPIRSVRELTDDQQVGIETVGELRSRLATEYASRGRVLAPSDVHVYEVRRDDGTSQVVGSTDPFDHASFQPGIDRTLRLVTPGAPTDAADASPAAAAPGG